MEAVMLHGSFEQPISSPYKYHIRNSKKINHSFISRTSENFLPSPEFHRSMGLLQAPPPFISRSYPPYSFQQPPQPPLLPLPAPNPHRNAAVRAPPANKKTNHGNNRVRDFSVTPKKSKFPKKEDRNSPKKSSDFVINVSSNDPLGPEPKDLAKDVQKVLPLISSSINTNSLSSVKTEEDNQVDIFSGSVTFTVSPPPSSLPLPTFSLRPKLSCKAEAAVIDAGATDNLRRLLRLR